MTFACKHSKIIFKKHFTFSLICDIMVSEKGRCIKLTKVEQMQELLEKRNGYLLSQDVIESGISKTYMSEFVKKHDLERVAQGVYMSADTWQDDLYILCLKNAKAILSYETALYIHELTEREPSETHVSVPYTYNAKHLRDRGLCVHQITNELYDMGTTTATTKFGNPVTVYDMERTICDMVKARSKKDAQMFIYAIKEYSRSKKKDISKLMKYAERLDVADEVRTYMEVLL